jgi:hypothetical protein
MSKNAAYFELDGALFRRRAGYVGVQDIWDGKQWVDYKGDGAKPSAWGSKITESDLPKAARSSAV